MTQYLLNGLMLGGIYGLMAVAYSLVYGVLGLVNFAFGEIFMFGAFIALFAMQGQIPLVDTQVGFIDVGFPLALLVGIVAAGLLGALGFLKGAKGLLIGSIVCAGLALLIGVYDIANINSVVDGPFGLEVEVGMGLYLTVLGAAAGVAGPILKLVRGRAA